MATDSGYIYRLTAARLDASQRGTGLPRSKVEGALSNPDNWIQRYIRT